MRTFGAIFLLLFLASCGTTVQLTNDFYNQRQAKDDSYFTAKSVNGPYRWTFYVERDSAYKAVHADSATLKALVFPVNAERTADSLNSHALGYWAHFRDILDVNYKTARGTK